MAETAVAAAQVNGSAALSRPDSPASVNSTAKRKRDASDDGEPDVNRGDTPKPAINGLHTVRDPKSLIRDFFDVLQSHDTSAPSLLKRPLPDAGDEAGEPAAKRAKSEDGKPISVTDKVTEDAYNTLDDLVADVSRVVDTEVKKMEVATVEAGSPANEDDIAKAAALKSKALELYRRESSYPNVPRALPLRQDLRESLPPSATGGVVLTTVGPAPTARPLYTSLQNIATANGALKAASDGKLPNGVTATSILPDPPAANDKAARTLTLGELFPSPRNLPPLQPPKAPKTTTKSNVLTFYHPELTEKSKYYQNAYFSQNVTTGHWLDYSNATPTIHAKTKQRERAQSLAGHKPSSTELEMSEMEALFRGAFSSFAPCKDDSAAIVPSGQVSRIWWQRVGRRNFERLVDSDASEEDRADKTASAAAAVESIDENAVKEAIEHWDDLAIDPSLDHVMGKKSDQEKEVDDLLEEVSDLIETLASYQRNRNLTLPTSQDRYSTDPVNGDMLRNGNLSHQPTEEEQATYEALKAQLSLIISTLPPYAVARLNSDKLEELAVSTKIEVRADEYRGVMEEDEPARLARQAAQATAASSQRQSHRNSSVSSAGGYGAHQYPNQFPSGARAMSNAQHYPQTPVRAQGPNMFPRGPSTVPVPQPHHSVQPRPPPPTQYRSQMYPQQLAKAPYGHANIPPQYAPSPTQPRMVPQHPHHNMGQPGTPSQRYPPGYPAGYPQHQQVHPQHPHQPQQQPPQQQHQPAQHSPHVQHPQLQPHAMQPAPMGQHPGQVPLQPQPPQRQSFPPYANGGHMPRTISPQVPQAIPYGQSPTPPQQQQPMPRPPYGSPAQGMPPNAMPRQQYNPASPAMMHPGGPRGQNLTGYATVMGEPQQRQVMEQARARAEVEQRVTGHMGKVTQGEVVGLAGIGLGGNVDVHKIAAAKMQMAAAGTPGRLGPSLNAVNGNGMQPGALKVEPMVKADQGTPR